MSDSFLIHSSKVPKGSTSSSGGGTTIVNNYTTVNNYTQAAGEDADNFKGKITVSDLLSIPESEIGENDLWLVYGAYSDTQGWSEDTFFMNPSRIKCVPAGSRVVLSRYTRADQRIRFVVEVQGGMSYIEIKPSDSAGGSLPGQPAWVYGEHTRADETITAAGDSTYYSIYTRDYPVIVYEYAEVDPATFSVYGSIAYSDLDDNIKAFKCWIPTNRRANLEAPALYDPLQPANDLITGLYSGTHYAKGLYGQDIYGIKLADLSCYTLGDDSIYHIDTFKQDGRYAGSTQTQTLVVPYARYYSSGGEIVYKGGALTDADYQRLIEGGGSDITIDTEWPASAQDDHVPSSRLVSDSVVFTFGNQTVTGAKTFTDSPTLAPGVNLNFGSNAYLGLESGIPVFKSGYTLNSIVRQVASGDETHPIYIDDAGKTRECSLAAPNNPSITIKQGAVTKGSFTLNQAEGGEINLDAAPIIDTRIPSVPSDDHVPSTKLADAIFETKTHAAATYVDRSSDQYISGCKHFTSSEYGISIDSSGFPAIKFRSSDGGALETIGQLKIRKTGLTSYPEFTSLSDSHTLVRMGAAGKGSETVPIYLDEYGVTQVCSLPPAPTIVTTWPANPTDGTVPSTKLVKDSLTHLVTTNSEQAITAKKSFLESFELICPAGAHKTINFRSGTESSSQDVGSYTVDFDEADPTRTGKPVFSTARAGNRDIVTVGVRGDAMHPVYVDASGKTQTATYPQSATFKLVIERGSSSTGAFSHVSHEWLNEPDYSISYSLLNAGIIEISVGSSAVPYTASVIGYTEKQECSLTHTRFIPSASSGGAFRFSVSDVETGGVLYADQIPYAQMALYFVVTAVPSIE